MSLGISTEGSGDFAPYLKYDAKAGRIFRAPLKDAGEKTMVDLTMGFVGAFDFANIEVGWLDFPSGAAPQYATQPLAQGIGPKPTAPGKWKQGFRINVALPGVPGVFEMASNAKATIAAFNELHDKVIAAPELAAGKVPVVALSGTEIVETPSPQGVQRNYKPIFVIQSWIDRPASLVKKTPAATPPAQATPPANHPPAGPAATGNQAFQAPPAGSFG
jgi:hypothetical protein